MTSAKIEHTPSMLSPASKASREVENFDWRKKNTPIRIWCQGIRHYIFAVGHKPPKNSYQDMHHSQGGMKFATQISPLLNYNKSVVKRHVVSTISPSKKIKRQTLFIILNFLTTDPLAHFYGLQMSSLI